MQEHSVVNLSIETHTRGQFVGHGDLGVGVAAAAKMLAKRAVLPTARFLALPAWAARLVPTLRRLLPRPEMLTRRDVTSAPRGRHGHGSRLRIASVFPNGDAMTNRPNRRLRSLQGTDEAGRRQGIRAVG